MFAGLDPLFIGDAGTIEILLIVIMKVVVAFGETGYSGVMA